MSNELAHLSEKPWGAYTASDYSIEQWHNACLIHQHDGPPTSKNQCKLPIKTPTGAVNRNGVYAAAAALAGARGGVNASTEEKAKASKVLIRLYKEMDKEPPASLMQSSIDIADFLEHYGRKGMRWGVRTTSPSSTTGRQKTSFEKSPKKLNEAELSRRIKRMELEKKYNDLRKPEVTAGKAYARGLLENSGRSIATAVVGGAAGFFVQRELRRRFPAAAAVTEAVT
ncbi:MAG: hypothetical protein ABWY25_02170 [Paenisporosarcina sp.]